jgi:putative endonuclease
MNYVYVLLSCNDGKFYTGATSDLKRRMKEHEDGNVLSTCRRTPLKLIYYEACISQEDAFRREKYLKTTMGKRYLRNRLKDTLAKTLTG